ncbi:hypothetical protein QBC43DRAFT_204655 [Cladorrhinum sp. PSN259]|nr:hypothetical protein QBC43DRAFT_204655 [Cladorrhinum sp. PSN259]
MSCPLASLVNPLKPDQVLLFFLTQHQSVGLSLYDVRPPRPDHEDPEDLVAITGIKTTSFRDNLSAPVDLKIVNPGSFSALKANNLINVYGFVQVAPPASGVKTIEPAATKRIAQLSPVYKVLLPDESTVDNVKRTNQRDLDIINTAMNQRPPLMATNLVAAFEPLDGKKSVIYQTKDSLRIVESNGNNGNDGRNGTGLALVPVTSEDTKKTKLYLYYFNGKGKLQSVVRDEDGKWGASSEKDTTTSDDNTALTASRVGKTILLHFIASDGSIKWVRDEIQL